MAEAGTSVEANKSTRRVPSTRTVMLWIVVAILLGIFLPPLVNVNRYKSDIATSLSRAVGRPVTVGHLELRLLPQPGFDLRDVEIADDPAISPEYLLHADEVTAYLRLSSLWRGRLEVARISLTDPSLNLVRAEDGRWNLETLLSRTTQIPAAPTAQAHPERERRRFPYIEATGGRINFKLGLEKKAFTFIDSDFALWLQSENKWNMRLNAKPIRVDTRVTDTGEIKMEGSFERNSMVRYTPVKFSLTWRDGQLGQMTKLLTGRDRGWRGGTSLTVAATGTPSDLVLTGDLRVDDFRRYDIFGGGTMRLAAHCTGTYIAAEEKLTGTQCAGPVAGGTVAVRGTVQRMSDPFFDLKMAGEGVSLNSVIALVRHAKRDLPEDLGAAGTADFTFSARRGMEFGAKTLWSGNGTTVDAVLHSKALGKDLPLGSLNYVIAPEVPKRVVRHGKAEIGPLQAQEIDRFRLEVAPFTVSLGAAAPVQAKAVVTDEGFAFTVAGDADVERALQVARALGIEAPKVAASGAAKVDIDVSGHWTGFEAPEVTGTAQFKNVTADIPGVIETLQVSAATAAITARGYTLQNVAASFARGPAFTGWVTVPANCGDACPLEFSVHADELSPERLNQLFNPKLRSRPWYNFFMPRPAGGDNPLKTVEATGRFLVDRLNMQGTVATHIGGTVRLANQHVSVSDLRAELFGGQHTGEWEADFSAAKPVFQGKGRMTRTSLGQAAAAMHDAWGTGTVDLTYELKMTGMSPEELRDSASGLAQFKMKDGVLRRLSLDGKAGVLKVSQFDGSVALRNGQFVFDDAKLQSGAAVYSVQGMASWSRELNLKLTDNQHAFALSGTLEHPEIKPEPAAQAALQSKP